MIDHPYVVRRAWQMTWRNRSLWLFGFLASLSGLLRFDARTTAARLPLEVQRQIAAALQGPHAELAIAALVFLLLLISFTLAVLGALGRGALIEQANHIENMGAPAAALAGLQAGKSHTWQVLVILFLLGLPASSVMAVGSASYIASAYALYLSPGPTPDLAAFTETAARFLACFLPALLLGLFLAVPLCALQRLAVRACVLEDRTIGGSVRRAWELAQSHLGALLVLWLILAGIGAGLTVTLGCPTGLLILGLLIPSRLLRSTTPSAQVALCGMSLLLRLAGAAVVGVMETFLSASWTLAYRELTGLGRTGEEGSAGQV